MCVCVCVCVSMTLPRCRPGRIPNTLAFLTWLLGRPEIADFRGLGGPGGPSSHSKIWGSSPPIFLNGLPAPPGPPRPRKSTISGRPKNHISAGYLKACLANVLFDATSVEPVGRPTSRFHVKLSEVLVLPAPGGRDGAPYPFPRVPPTGPAGPHVPGTCLGNKARPALGEGLGKREGEDPDF
jgi:hypothetical protein